MQYTAIFKAVAILIAIKMTIEQRHEKTKILHMRKQRRRSASQ